VCDIDESCQCEREPWEREHSSLVQVLPERHGS
jgi:hypothetical protein